MAELPTTTPTINAIYRSYETVEEQRPYLGCSELGDECRRKLWYRFRWVARPSFDGRIKRLFDTGKREEERILADLRKIGITIDCQQMEAVACDGHLKGHIDAAGLGFLEAPKTWHLIEVKTNNAKGFAAIVKDGVQKAKPQHYAQMQLYMGLLGLTRAAYIVHNKDTDELHLERVRFDREAFDALLLKAQGIIGAESPPDRIAKDPSFYLCKFCMFSNHCYGERFPDVNCRTCAHSSPAVGGMWSCAKGLVVDHPVCAEHIYLPSMLHWLEPIDGDPEHVVYKCGNNLFANVAATGFCARDIDSYSSRQLACTN